MGDNDGMRVFRSFVFLVLPLLFVACIATTAKPGPDFVRYMDWNRAFLSGEIRTIRSVTASPLGLPVSLWSHGPGLLYAIPGMLFWNMTHEQSAAAASIGAIVVFWVSAAVVFGVVARGEVRLAVFGLLVMFLATPAGFYSMTYASETFSIMLVVLILLITTGILSPESGIIHLLGAGSVAGLLLIVRPQLAVYLIIPGVALFVRGYREHPFPIARVAMSMVPLAVPVLVSAAQILFVNRWMTGSFFRSPYMFGFSNFHSVDVLRPEFAAVLLHPWHGLLVYHPWFLVGTLTCAVWFVTARSKVVRMFVVAALVAGFLHLYVHASWYAWWLGMGTFGLRGMSPFGVVLAVAFTGWLAEPDRGRIFRTLSIVLTVVAAIWSYPMLFSGETNYVSFTALGIGYSQMMRFHGGNMLVAAAYLLPGIVAFAFRKRGGRPDVLSRATAVLGTMALAYVRYRLLKLGIDWVAVDVCMGVVVSVIWALLAIRVYPTHVGERFPVYGAGVAAAYLAATILMFGGMIFWGLALKTERLVANGPLYEPNRYRQSYTTDLDEVLDSYREYQSVYGFETKKRELKDFLEAVRPANP